jgi:hypothetical protein
MSLRSLFAALATVWFIYLATTYMAPGTFLSPDPTMEVGQAYREVLAGSDLGLTMTSVVRAFAVGFALFSAAAFEWGALLSAYRASEARRRDNEAPATMREGKVISQQGDAEAIQPAD